METNLYDVLNNDFNLKASVKLRLCHNYIKERPEQTIRKRKLKLSNGRREANLQRRGKMAKGDDNVQRKKNKVTRKKMSRKNDTATVSARIAAIIAAKKRRKSGKRSMCQVSHSFLFDFRVLGNQKCSISEKSIC